MMEQKIDYSILGYLLEGCQVIDFDLRYVYVSEVAAKHGRKTRDELLGRVMLLLEMDKRFMRVSGG